MSLSAVSRQARSFRLMQAIAEDARFRPHIEVIK